MIGVLFSLYHKDRLSEKHILALCFSPFPLSDWRQDCIINDDTGQFNFKESSSYRFAGLLTIQSRFLVILRFASPGWWIGPSQSPLPVQHTEFTREQHPYPGGIWTCNSNKRAVADLRLSAATGAGDVIIMPEKQFCVRPVLWIWFIHTGTRWQWFLT